MVNGRRCTTEQTQNRKNRKNDRDVCPQCSEKVNDEECGMECDDCKFWYHLKCSKISKATYELLNKNDDLQWRCIKCKKEFEMMKSRMEELKEENKILQEKLSVLEDKFDSLKEEIKNEIVIEIGNKIVDEVKKTVSESLRVVKDTEDKKNRESNIIMYNVKESTKPNGKDREKDDQDIYTKVYEHCVKGEKKADIEKIVRLGKVVRSSDEETRTRPLLIKFKNVSDKWKLLKNARNMKNAPEVCKKVIIAPDLTKEERERDRNLRAELKRRKENGEVNLVIKKNQIVINESPNPFQV